VSRCSLGSYFLCIFNHCTYPKSGWSFSVVSEVFLCCRSRLFNTNGRFWPKNTPKKFLALLGLQKRVISAVVEFPDIQLSQEVPPRTIHRCSCSFDRTSYLVLNQAKSDGRQLGIHHSARFAFSYHISRQTRGKKNSNSPPHMASGGFEPSPLLKHPV